MKSLNVSDVRKSLPALIDAVVASHEEIIITRHGKPVAKLMACDDVHLKGDYYPLRGVPIRISDDFDEPMLDLWAVLAE